MAGGQAGRRDLQPDIAGAYMKLTGQSGEAAMRGDGQMQDRYPGHQKRLNNADNGFCKRKNGSVSGGW